MPRILLDGCDTTKTLQQIKLDVEVVFRGDYFKEYPVKVREKMEILESQLGEVLKQWFDDYGSDIMSNHEYNLIMKGDEFFNR